MILQDYKDLINKLPCISTNVPNVYHDEHVRSILGDVNIRASDHYSINELYATALVRIAGEINITVLDLAKYSERDIDTLKCAINTVQAYMKRLEENLPSMKQLAAEDFIAVPDMTALSGCRLCYFNLSGHCSKGLVQELNEKHGNCANAGHHYELKK